MAKVKMSVPYEVNDWEVERDLDALTRATAVKKDPERMKKVKELAKRKLEENKIRRDAAQQAVDIGEGKDPA